MAVTVTEVGRRTTLGDRRVRFHDLTFSGNYATGGEAITAATLGLSRLDWVSFDGMVMAADEATGLIPGYDYGAEKVTMYEGSAAGTALSEKTNAEAYPTGARCRVMVVGV